MECIGAAIAIQCAQKGDQVHIKRGKMEAASAFRSGRVLDVTVIDCISLDPVDIVTAGPPCPPWSSLACGKTTEDPRAEVFNAVVECVIHWLHQPGARWVLKYSFWRMSWAFSNPGRVPQPSCQSCCVIFRRRCHGSSTALKWLHHPGPWSATKPHKSVPPWIP